MKVLQIGPVPPECGGTAIGGVASHVWGLSRALADAGHDVAILADNVAPTVPRRTVRDGVEIDAAGHRLSPAPPVDVVGALRSTGGHRVVRAVDSAKVLDCRQVMHSLRPDVVHVHGVDDRAVLARLAAGGRYPVVASVHSSHFIDFDDVPDRTTRCALVRSNLEGVDGLIFVSHFVLDRHHALFPNVIHDRPVHVIHNPADASHFAPLPRDDARRRLGATSTVPLLLFVGQYIPRKRAALLIDAAVLLARDGAAFAVRLVGAGPEENALRELIDRRGLDDRVSVCGAVPQLVLPDYYSAADLLVHPSAMEGFALACVEAMLCGCPVVGSAASLRELIVSDELGVLVPSPTAAGLATALLDAMSTAWDRSAIRRHAEHFGWERRVGDFVRCYEEVA
jgi:glycosyltransferase involved in cell wall biosynthesis